MAVVISKLFVIVLWKTVVKERAIHRDKSAGLDTNMTKRDTIPCRLGKQDAKLRVSKVSFSFQLKRRHQRVQRTKKRDVAQLANSETQDTLRDNIASALEDLEETEYKDAASH